MPSTFLACPMCGAPTSAPGGGQYAVKEKGIRRRRVCTADTSHEFSTIERPNVEDLLLKTQVHIKDQVHEFDRARLARDLDYAIGDVLNTRARRAVADRVQHRLAAHLPPMTPRDASLPSGVVARLTSSVVQEEVAQALYDEASDYATSDQHRRTFRRAHLMWVLARGTTDGRFREVADVLDWLRDTYGRQADRTGAGFRVERHYAAVATDTWHPLRNDAAPEPKFIVFLIRTEVPARTDGTAARTRHEHRRDPFNRQRLLRSVRHSLAGRDDHTRIAKMVVQWVLWSLGGQTVVRSADLTSQVTQCLRRVDEIAYLRWCVQVKDLDLNDVWHEGLGLLSWPSPRLVFAPEAAQDPRRLEHVMPSPSQAAVKDLPQWQDPQAGSSKSDDT